MESSFDFPKKHHTHMIHDCSVKEKNHLDFCCDTKRFPGLELNIFHLCLSSQYCCSFQSLVWDCRCRIFRRALWAGDFPTMASRDKSGEVGWQLKSGFLSNSVSRAIDVMLPFPLCFVLVEDGESKVRGVQACEPILGEEMSVFPRVRWHVIESPT